MRKYLFLGSIALLAFFNIGCAPTFVVYQRPSPPPPRRVEIRAFPPCHSAVWVSGCWKRKGRHRGYVWVPGYWRVM